MRIPRPVAVLVFSSLLTLSAPVWGGDPDWRPIIALQLRSDSHSQVTHLAVQSGDRASFALPDGRSRLELKPTVPSPVEGEVVAVEIFEVRDTPKGESSRWVEQVSLRRGQRHPILSHPQASIALEAIRWPRPGDLQADPSKPGSAIVTVGLQRPSMEKTTAKVREGEVLRVGAAGDEIAIRPRLLVGDRVEFQVFQLPLESQLNERSYPFERFILKKSAEYISDTSPRFALTLQDIKPIP